MAIRAKSASAHDGDHRRHRRSPACRSARARGSAIRRSSSASGPRVLEDGTLAGSMLTMDGAFRMLVKRVGAVAAEPRACARRRPAEAMGLARYRRRSRSESAADLVVLEPRSARSVRPTSAGEPRWNTEPTRSVYCPEVHMRLTAATAARRDHCVGRLRGQPQSEGLSAREIKTFKVTGQPELVLDTFDGAIELHSWDRHEVEVEIEKRAMEQALLDEIKVDDEQQGDVIIIKVTGPTRTRIPRRHRRRAHFADRAAARRGAAQQQHPGDQRRRLDSRRSDRRQARAHDRRRQRHRHAARRRHSDSHRATASIRLDNVTGKLDLETTDGSIGLDAQADGAAARAPATARFARPSNPTRRWPTTGSSRPATAASSLTLPGLFNAELDAETSDGSVRTTHPLLDDDRAERRDGEDSDERRERRRTLRSKMGEGGKLLNIRTGDGTIRIER